MASPLVDVATGITVVFTTSSFTAEIRDIGGPTLTRGSIDTSHQGTTNALTSAPVDLYDPGEMTMSIHFNPDKTPPVTTAAETVTITWPSGATWAFTGFCTDYGPTGPFNDKMTADLTIKVGDEITITPAT